jgi:hypothetical protein
MVGAAVATMVASSAAMKSSNWKNRQDNSCQQDEGRERTKRAIKMAIVRSLLLPLLSSIVSELGNDSAASTGSVVGFCISIAGVDSAGWSLFFLESVAIVETQEKI